MHFANVFLFCLFGERAPSYLQPFQARKSELRMQSANWSLFIPAGLAEGGKNIEQRHQRQWMARIKNFLKSLEEVLTTPIIVCFTCEWGRKCGQRVNAKRAFIHKHEGAPGRQRVPDQAQGFSLRCENIWEDWRRSSTLRLTAAIFFLKPRTWLIFFYWKSLRRNGEKKQQQTVIGAGLSWIHWSKSSVIIICSSFKREPRWDLNLRTNRCHCFTSCVVQRLLLS